MSEYEMLQFRLLQLEEYRRLHDHHTEESSIKLAALGEWKDGMVEWRKEQQKFQTVAIFMLIGNLLACIGALVLLVFKH